MYYLCHCDGIGRHEGLKIPWPEMAVQVQILSVVLIRINMKEINLISLVNKLNPDIAITFPASCLEEYEESYSIRATGCFGIYYSKNDWIKK